jgi:hypothetical protein
VLQIVEQHEFSVLTQSQYLKTRATIINWNEYFSPFPLTTAEENKGTPKEFIWYFLLYMVGM